MNTSTRPPEPSEGSGGIPAGRNRDAEGAAASAADAATDPYLRAALRHAPDAGAAAPAAVGEAILKHAREAIAAVAPPVITTPATGRPGWPSRLQALWAALARPPVAAAMASLMLATTLGLWWQDGPWVEPFADRAPEAPMANAPAGRATSAAPSAPDAPAEAAAPAALRADAAHAAATAPVKPASQAAPTAPVPPPLTPPVEPRAPAAPPQDSAPPAPTDAAASPAPRGTAKETPLAAPAGVARARLAERSEPAAALPATAATAPPHAPAAAAIEAGARPMPETLRLSGSAVAPPAEAAALAPQTSPPGLAVDDAERWPAPARLARQLRGEAARWRWSRDGGEAQPINEAVPAWLDRLAMEAEAAGGAWRELDAQTDAPAADRGRVLSVQRDGERPHRFTLGSAGLRWEQPGLAARELALPPAALRRLAEQLP